MSLMVITIIFTRNRFIFEYQTTNNFYVSDQTKVVVTESNWIFLFILVCTQVCVTMILQMKRLHSCHLTKKHIKLSICNKDIVKIRDIYSTECFLSSCARVDARKHDTRTAPEHETLRNICAKRSVKL